MIQPTVPRLLWMSLGVGVGVAWCSGVTARSESDTAPVPRAERPPDAALLNAFAQGTGLALPEATVEPGFMPAFEAFPATADRQFPRIQPDRVDWSIVGGTPSGLSVEPGTLDPRLVPSMSKLTTTATTATTATMAAARPTSPTSPTPPAPTVASGPTLTPLIATLAAAFLFGSLLLLLGLCEWLRFRRWQARILGGFSCRACGYRLPQRYVPICNECGRSSVFLRPHGPWGWLLAYARQRHTV